MSKGPPPPWLTFSFYRHDLPGRDFALGILRHEQYEDKILGGTVWLDKDDTLNQNKLVSKEESFMDQLTSAPEDCFFYFDIPAIINPNRKGSERLSNETAFPEFNQRNVVDICTSESRIAARDWPAVNKKFVNLCEALGVTYASIVGEYSMECPEILAVDGSYAFVNFYLGYRAFSDKTIGRVVEAAGSCYTKELTEGRYFSMNECGNSAGIRLPDASARSDTIARILGQTRIG